MYRMASRKKGVFHSTKGLRQCHEPAKQCAKPGNAGLRLASRLSQKGPLGCSVHFWEFSACKAVCIRIGSVNQRLQAPLYSVLEQASRSAGTQMRASGRICRQKLPRGPYVARLWRYRQHLDAENSAFCTAQTGVSPGKTRRTQIICNSTIFLCKTSNTANVPSIYLDWQLHPNTSHIHPYMYG